MGEQDGVALPREVTEPEQVIADVVCAVEPRLPPGDVVEVVLAVVKRLPARRELALALTADPTLLTSGRSDGPRAVGRLIRALVERDARALAVPRCAVCGAQRPLKGRTGTGEQQCGSCQVREIGHANPCAVCGSPRFSGRDRQGLPRCRQHPPEPDRDVPGDLAALLEAATGLPRATVEQAVTAVERTRGGQLKLLWALEDVPDLLTGAGARGPAKTTALIRALADRGAPELVIPACPRCGKTSELNMTLDGARCCRGCWRRAHPAPCSRCGKERWIAARSLAGEPLCVACRGQDPVHQGVCGTCGRRGHITRRTDAGAVCADCYEPPVATCTTCGRTRPCRYAASAEPRCLPCTIKARPHRPCSRCGATRRIQYRAPDGAGLCGACGEPRFPCARCGATRRLHGRAPDGGPLCKPCWATHPAARRACASCGSVERPWHHDLCPACAAPRQLTDVLRGPHPTVRPGLEAVHRALLETIPPPALLRALGRGRGLRALLDQLAAGAGPVTHQVLDRAHPPKSAHALRALLVAGGALPARDEHLAALERWLDRTYPRITDPEERRLVRSFTTWTHLRRLRRTRDGRPVTYGQITAVRHEVRSVVRLLEWLPTQYSTLADCTQDLLDVWLAQSPPGHSSVRTFLNWTARRGHARPLNAPLTTTNFAVNLIGQDRRWEQVRRLVDDTELHVVDRAAGLLLLLFAQPTARITQLTTDHVDDDGTRVTLRLGRAPVDLPPPLTDLVRALVLRRRGRSAATTDTSTWLFPGGLPGRPLAASHLNHRLKAIGIRPRASRQTALLDLAAELPAVVVARLLGFSQSTADHWRQESGALAAEYAADISLR